MTTIDRGPADDYEVILTSGAVLHVTAHQALMPPLMGPLFGETEQRRRYTFHGEVDGRWKLLLDLAEEDVVSVRNVTHVGDSL